MMTPVQMKRMLYLFGVLREETITPQEMAELTELLETQSQARDYYIDYVYLCTDLCNLQAATPHNSVFWDVLQASEQPGDKSADSSVLFETMKLLGEDEKQAETVVVQPKQQEGCDEILKIGTPKTIRKINRTSLYTALLATAALVMMFLYVYLNPKSSIEVATLEDAINADWTAGLPFNKGVRIATESQPIKLHRGVVKMITDEDVRILIEGPAEFKFTAPSQITLNYGKLFSTVSQDGRGFTVQTPTSKIIDLGTEFGVLANAEKSTELHVFKGKTVFIGETQNHGRKVLDAIAGEAIRLEQDNDSILNITLDENTFVRSIDSQSRLLWRGQKIINLADVVGGGDGFGTGRINVGINPQTGVIGVTEYRDRKSTNRYVPVADNVFVDGVFVPNGDTEQVVSSVGHIFPECPSTKSLYYVNIMNTPTGDKEYPLILDDVDYSQPQNPCIYLHSNLGVTFDLDAFRTRLQNVKLSKFECIAGISESTPKGYFNADIYVLVDGQLRYKKEQIRENGGEAISVELHDKDRFLTLISTDGGDEWTPIKTTDRPRSSTGRDWVIFGRPMLILE